jgi:hypothetical protein
MTEAYESLRDELTRRGVTVQQVSLGDEELAVWDSRTRVLSLRESASAMDREWAATKLLLLLTTGTP